MPRRRMLDPSFFDDPNVASLTRDERLFLLGCIRNADDEGRLKAHHAYLKAEIFMYDEDIPLEKMKEIRDSALEKMNSWPEDCAWRILLYENCGSKYLFFPSWYEQQKPSHPSPSKLPAPPDEIARKPPANLMQTSGESRGNLVPTSGNPHEALASPSALGQSSLGQDSIGKSSLVEVHEDFMKFSGNESDLTDYLTKTLKKYISLGRDRALAGPGAGLGGGGPGQLPADREAFNRAQYGILVLEKFWKQLIGRALPSSLWQGGHEALKKYPVEIVARAFVKAGRYQGGKHNSWKYIQTIIDELGGKR